MISAAKASSFFGCNYPPVVAPSPPLFFLVLHEKSFLLVAKHDSFCNVDGAAAEGASSQRWWRRHKPFLNMYNRGWGLIWRKLRCNLRGFKRRLLYLTTVYPDNKIWINNYFFSPLIGHHRSVPRDRVCRQHKSEWMQAYLGGVHMNVLFWHS